MVLRKTVLFVSTIVLLAMLVTPVSAQNILKETDNIIQPYFTNILIFKNGFDISSSGQATVSMFLIARNVDSVKLDVSLQQYNNGTWQTIKEWTSTSSGTSAELDKAYYVNKGYSYRMVSNGYVYQNGILVENASFISNIVSY